MKKHWLFLTMISFVAFTSCSDDDDNGDTPTPPVDVPTEVSSVTITPADTTIYTCLNEALPTLSIKVAPDDAEDKTITWSSDEKEYVTVDKNGALTLVKKPEQDITVTITATSANDKKGKCTINLIALIDKKYGVIDGSETVGLFILDRNIGATEVYNGDPANPNAASFGNFYQWGKNEVVATGNAIAVNYEYNKEWNAEGDDFADWTVAENTPCPEGWRIPSKTDIEKITTFMECDYDWDTFEPIYTEEQAAFYESLKIVGTDCFIIKGADETERADNTPELYAGNKFGYFWTSTISDLTPNKDRGFKFAYVLNADGSLYMNGKFTQNEVNVAMPIRCIKDAPSAEKPAEPVAPEA